MSDREKARDLGNQSAALAPSIADVLNDTLDALEAAEVEVARLRERLGEECNHALIAGTTRCIKCGAASMKRHADEMLAALADKEGT